MIQITVDTSLVVGLLDHRDIWHSKSLALKKVLIENDAQIVIYVDGLLKDRLLSELEKVFDE